MLSNQIACMMRTRWVRLELLRQRQAQPMGVVNCERRLRPRSISTYVNIVCEPTVRCYDLLRQNQSNGPIAGPGPE